MTTGPDWQAANDHLKGTPPGARVWMRPRGGTWYRPVAADPVEADAAPPDRPHHRLITAGRVANATVYSHAGKRLGRIAEIAIDDVTDDVAFVLLAEGGFLGFGEHFRRVPWAALAYDAGRMGYILDVAEARGEDARCGKVTFQRAGDRGGWATGA